MANMPSPSKPQAPSRAARDEEEEVRVFNLLRQEIARKKTMEGHTLSDSRAHFAKNTPKSARRSGLLTHSRFIIAVQRLELGLDAHDLNVLTAALDPEGRGVVDPAAFLQEAHNHRHHDRVRQRGPTSYHLASPRSQLAQPTWMSPRGGRYTGGVAGLSGAFTERRAGPQPSVVTVSSRDGLTRFSSKNSTEWVRPADSVALLRSDYLLKGGGRLASPSADLAFAAEATGGLVLDSPKVGFKVVEKPYYVNALDVQVSQRMRPPQPHKWLMQQVGGWNNSLPTKTVPAAETGLPPDTTQHMAQTPGRFRPNPSLTNIGSPRTTMVFGTFQRGSAALKPAPPQAPRLGKTPDFISEKQLAKLRALPDLQTSMQQLRESIADRKQESNYKQRMADKVV